MVCDRGEPHHTILSDTRYDSDRTEQEEKQKLWTGSPCADLLLFISFLR